MNLVARFVDALTPVPLPGRPLAVGPGGNRALTLSPEGSVALWDLDRKSILHQWNDHARGVAFAEFDEDGSRAVTIGRDRVVAVREATSGALLQRRTEAWADGDFLSATADGKRVLTRTGRETLHVWETQAGARLSEIRTAVDVAGLTPDGQCVFSRSWDGRHELWDTEAGARIRSWEGELGSFTAACSRVGRRILFGSESGRLVLWEAVAGGTLRGWSPSGSGRMTAVGLDATGSLVFFIYNGTFLGICLPFGVIVGGYRWDPGEISTFVYRDESLLLGGRDGNLRMCRVRLDDMRKEGLTGFPPGAET